MHRPGYQWQRCTADKEEFGIFTADMSKNKSPISEAKSYQEIADLGDTHDLSDYWDKTKEVKFEVDIESEKTYYGVEKKLS